MLAGAASRVGPLPLRLREGAHLKRGVGGGLVSDTSPVFLIFNFLFNMNNPGGNY